ncbi:pyridoxal phosphate-dependent decarboxylase family protein [Flagellimonas allohymeniacidonis]|uniref:Aspartate aminotransferase family protein n=1 Tax=Flagellimonas allohymeniacidonis TaxID=2517819 RepID=A0A4Q8QF97_9FLAO|nr:aminotransferase class V-fold PLP-dependent enzyme [Allomuricauda hymeniacidonis]TAI49155.1 aspartate aminotransferase family protein [Allomuricauda hymeniacidonis]
MKLQEQMRAEFSDKTIFEKAQKYAYDYLDGISEMDVFPSEESLELLKKFDEKLPEKSTSALDTLDFLNNYGTPNTIAQIGGRYFGFVNGGAVPASLGVKWLSDVWDQCAGLYLTSPINAKLESVCEKWLKDLFGLPESTVAGFVSGTSMANLCALAAARFQLLKNLGWDINEKGLIGAPNIRIIAHEQVHASVKKTLALLGFGKNSLEWIPSDDQGRLMLDTLPKLDSSCLVLLQAGNVNTGGYDPFDKVCDMANAVGAWVHVDGAFGLWAGACDSLKHLTHGMEKASSWAVDGHKTLNTPYDSGIVLCRHPKAMVSALQASGEYIIYSDQRDPLLYTPELSKRARAIELWATLRYLGKSGINEMVQGFHLHAKRLAKSLKELGFEIMNEVVFNQVLVRFKDDDSTKKIIAHLQNSGECWLGGTTWQGKAAIRVSICSWATTEEDIAQTIALFQKAKTALG